jgi:hypothetical protein
LRILPITVRNYRAMPILLLNSTPARCRRSTRCTDAGEFDAPLPSDLQGQNEADWDRT